MKKRKGILIVSFGTSYSKSFDKTIGVIEKKIEDAFPQFALYRAFTSQRIIDKIENTKSIQIDSVGDALKRMAKDGIDYVIVEFANILNGMEHDKVMSEVQKHENMFKKISMGRPLLSDMEDYKKVVHAIMSSINLNDEEILVLMGRGTSHHATSAYPTLEYTFHAMGYERVLVGTIEGFPGLSNVMKKLNDSDINKVKLMPFLLIAGGHLQKDMIGEEDSWLIKLQDAGYEVETIMNGLGEIEGIQNIFLEHIEEVM